MIASKALDVASNLGTQRVIGFTRSVTRTKGKKHPKLIQESVNIGLQAWEIGAILAGVALYEYVNGAGSLLNNALVMASGKGTTTAAPESITTSLYNFDLNLLNHLAELPL